MDKLIISLLCHLGLSSKYKGFFCLAAAIEIAMRDPESLTMITKSLYPQVAKQQNTNWKTVERNIGSAIDIIWRRNAPGFRQLTGWPVDSKPSNAKFIAIIVYYLQHNRS